MIQRIFAMLTQGDPQSALETYEALERLIDRHKAPSQSRSAAGSESRESKKLAAETIGEERSAAVDSYQQQKAEYLEARRQLEAARAAAAELERKLASFEDLQGEIESLKAQIEAGPVLSLEESGMGRNFQETLRALQQAKEALPITDEALAEIKALAEKFATDADSPGVLTSAEADYLASKLLSVPTVAEYSGTVGAHVQVSRELVEAAIAGFEDAGLGDAATELLGAQLAQVAWINADSVYHKTTLPGNGKAALQPYLRSSDPNNRFGHQVWSNPQELPANAAHVTYEQRREFAFSPGSSSRVDALEALQPTERGTYQSTFRFTPEATDFPMTLQATATPITGKGDSLLAKQLYRLSEAENGKIRVELIDERHLITAPEGQGVGPNGTAEQAWRWGEPSQVFELERGEDGGFSLGVEVPGSDSGTVFGLRVR
ncbi:MAG: hypothetical protein AAFY60_04790, partial [Myxococcota bacterium]